VPFNRIDSIVEGLSSHVSCASAVRVSAGGSHRLRRRCVPELQLRAAAMAVADQTAWRSGPTVRCAWPATAVHLSVRCY